MRRAARGRGVAVTDSGARAFAEHFGIRMNPEVYYIDKLPVHIDPSEFLAVGIAAILVSLLVTIYPAQLASRLRPGATMLMIDQGAPAGGANPFRRDSHGA